MTARGKTRAWLAGATAGLGMAFLAGTALLCENAIRIPAPYRHAPPAALADALARETGSRWQEAEIAAADGVRLRAWWFMPAHPRGAVILLHGIADTRRGMLGHARFLLESGYAALLPDSRGHGSSGGANLSFAVRGSGGR